MTIVNQFIKQARKKQGKDHMKAMNQEAQKFPGLHLSRRNFRKTYGHLSWVHEHLQVIKLFSIDRVPFPDKGERVGRRGRKATGQGWSLIVGLLKEESFKRQRMCQDFRAH